MAHPEPGDHLDEMLRKLGRSLFGTELMRQGVNGDYSSGAAGYWVENGRIVHPVHELTIAGSLKVMLRRIVALGADTCVAGGKTGGSMLIGRLKVAGS